MSEETAARQEQDTLGQYNIPHDALWGIHTARALDNFPRSRLPQHFYFYRALAEVKLAAAQANIQLGFLQHEIGTALVQALGEMRTGLFFDAFIVDPVQGGAGTSANMNCNEIAANRATEILGGRRGEYRVHPLEHVNLHQSTNDVYPTALKLTTYYYLRDLEAQVNELLCALQKKEQEFSAIVKIGRTQLMPAVPTTLGKEFSAYADAIGRDRWRIFKSMERIRQINLGGTAIGTGIAAPRQYIFLVTEKLRDITGLPLARAENLIDATQNHDQIAEVFGMIKVLALNLEKISGDLRLMASFEEIELPKVQIGSSVMPGKYNPVIPEMVSLVAKKVIGNELSASLCIAQGNLELNAFLPLVAYTLFESSDLLIQAVRLLRSKCIEPLTARKDVCLNNLLGAAASSAVLLPVIGYDRASTVAQYMNEQKTDLITAVNALGVMPEQDLLALLTPERINALGYTQQHAQR